MKAKTLPQLLRILHNERPQMIAATLDDAILQFCGNESDLTYTTMRRIAARMSLVNPALVHDLYETVIHYTGDWPEEDGFGSSDFDTILRTYEIRYLRSLQPGEKVVETARICTQGKTGEVYIGTGEQSKGSTCVKWSDGMGTAATHGTRRIQDTLHGCPICNPGGFHKYEDEYNCRQNKGPCE